MPRRPVHCRGSGSRMFLANSGQWLCQFCAQPVERDDEGNAVDHTWTPPDGWVDKNPGR